MLDIVLFFCIGVMFGAVVAGICVYNHLTFTQYLQEHRDHLKDTLSKTITSNRSSYLNLVHEQRTAVLQIMVAAVTDPNSGPYINRNLSALQTECDVCATPVHAAFLASRHPDCALDGMLVDKIVMLQGMSRCKTLEDLQNHENAIIAINGVIAQLRPHL